MSDSRFRNKVVVIAGGAKNLGGLLTSKFLEQGARVLVHNHSDNSRQYAEPRIFRNSVQGTPPITAVVGTGHVAFVTGRPGPAASGRAQVIELDQAARVPLGALTARHIENPSRDAFLTAAANTLLD